MLLFTPIPSHNMPQYQPKPTPTTDTNSTNSQLSYEEHTEEDLQDRRRKRTGKPSKDKGNTTTMHLVRHSRLLASLRTLTVFPSDAEHRIVHPNVPSEKGRRNTSKA